VSLKHNLDSRDSSQQSESAEAIFSFEIKSEERQYPKFGLELILERQFSHAFLSYTGH